MARFPAYLQKDVRRAKRLGVRVKNNRPLDDNSVYRYQGKKNGKPKGRILLEQRTRKSERLAALRHEIGHHEVHLSPHDKRRLNKTYRDRLHRFLRRAEDPNDRLNVSYPLKHMALKGGRRSARMARLHREEMLAWKNAMRQSPRANIGSAAWKSFDSYGYMDAKHATSVKTLKRYQSLIRRPGFRAQFNRSK